MEVHALFAMGEPCKAAVFARERIEDYRTVSKFADVSVYHEDRPNNAVVLRDSELDLPIRKPAREPDYCYARLDFHSESKKSPARISYAKLGLASCFWCITPRQSPL